MTIGEIDLAERLKRGIESHEEKLKEMNERLAEYRAEMNELMEEISEKESLVEAMKKVIAGLEEKNDTGGNF